MSRRDGFTLIELMMVVVIIGILATVAVSGLQRSRSKALFATVRSDLRVLAVQQEKYFSQEYLYAATVSDIADFSPSEGVLITINHTGPSTWGATATHRGLAPGDECGLYIGDTPEAQAAAGPATSEAVVTCTE